MPPVFVGASPAREVLGLRPIACRAGSYGIGVSSVFVGASPAREGLGARDESPAGQAPTGGLVGLAVFVGASRARDFCLEQV